MLTDGERNVLNIGLQKFRPGQSESILVGGENLLKPAVAADERVPVAHRGDQGRRSVYKL
jgi:hypothetical protein